MFCFLRSQVQLASLHVSGLLPRSTVWSKWTEEFHHNTDYIAGMTECCFLPLVSGTFSANVQCQTEVTLLPEPLLPPLLGQRRPSALTDIFV